MGTSDFDLNFIFITKNASYTSWKQGSLHNDFTPDDEARAPDNECNDELMTGESVKCTFGQKPKGERAPFGCRPMHYHRCPLPPPLAPPLPLPLAPPLPPPLPPPRQSALGASSLDSASLCQSRRFLLAAAALPGPFDGAFTRFPAHQQRWRSASSTYT